MKKFIKTYKIEIIFGLILSIWIVSILISSNKIYEERIKEEFTEQREVPDQSLLDSVYTEILALRLDHPNIVFSQFMLESDSCRSPLFKRNKNLCGMRASGGRATTSTKIVGGYKYFNTWRDCVLDYALLQMAFYRKLTTEEYYQRLQSNGYAEDVNYIKKLKQNERN